MKKTFCILAILLAVLFSTSLYAFNANEVEETRSVTGFERIRLQGSPDIKYTQGKTWSVRVKAPKSLISKVVTRKEGNCLVVSLKNTGFFSREGRNSDVTVYVTSPDLIGVEVQGSGDFESKTHVDTDNLDISLRGSGDINFYDIICDRLKTSVVGSGDLDIKKIVAQQSVVELVGSGDVKVRQSKVHQTQIELKGSGDVKVHCDNCGTVTCRLVGSGDITLSGTISKLNQTTRGSGDIHTESLKIK